MSNHILRVVSSICAQPDNQMKSVSIRVPLGFTRLLVYRFLCSHANRECFFYTKKNRYFQVVYVMRYSFCWSVPCNLFDLVNQKESIPLSNAWPNTDHVILYPKAWEYLFTLSYSLSYSPLNCLAYFFRHPYDRTHRVALEIRRHHSFRFRM